MTNQGNYHYQSNFINPDQYRRPVSSLFDLGSTGQDRTNSSQGSQSSNYQGVSYPQSYDGSSNQGGYASRYNSYDGCSRREDLRKETSQQASYPPQAKSISHLFDVSPDNPPQAKSVSHLFDVSPSKNYNRFERMSESTYQQNQDRRNQSGNDYRTPESNYQQNYQGRVNESGNNYQQPYQANLSGRKPISDMFDIPSNSNTFGGQSGRNYDQYQDRSGSGFQRENETGRFDQETYSQDVLSSNHQRGSNNSGSSYRGRGQFSGGNADFRQKNFTNNSNPQQTSGSNSFQGKFMPQRGRGKHRFHDQKPYNKVGTNSKHVQGQELSQHEEDHNSDGEEGVMVKEFVLNVSPSLVEKYKTHPPTAEEMGNIFKGFVVFFHWKQPKLKSERNPFVIICESFRKSDRFDPIEVQDGCQQGDKFTKYCTMRYQGMLMTRGVGITGNMKEPRVMAGLDVINKLAMTCYTLKVKEEYFHNAGLPIEFGNKDIPGVYRVVLEEEVPDLAAARKMVSDLVESDSDCELAFTNSKLIHPIKNFSKDKTMCCETRLSKEAVVVCKARTPQYWRDKILASGKMENNKFNLIPPQGLGKELLKDIDLSSFIPKLKVSKELGTKFDPYGPEVKILQITVPWEQKEFQRRRNNNRNNKRNKNRKARK